MPISPGDIERAERVLDDNKEVILKLSGVVHVFVSLLESIKPDDERKVGLIVEVRDAESIGEVEFAVIELVGDFPLQVQVQKRNIYHALEGGDLCALSYDAIQSFAIPGSGGVPAGTIGVCFKDNGVEYLMSCGHVIASSIFDPTQVFIGSDIATWSNPITRYDVATLSNWTPLLASENIADAAIARVNGGSEANLMCVRDSIGLHNVVKAGDHNERKSARRSLLGSTVFMRGSTSRTTEGIVVGHNVPVTIEGAVSSRAYISQLRIEATQRNYFSQQGDSGALVYQSDGAGGFNAVGLVIAGSLDSNGAPGKVSYATFIEDVMAELQIGEMIR